MSRVKSSTLLSNISPKFSSEATELNEANKISNLGVDHQETHLERLSSVGTGREGEKKDRRALTRIGLTIRLDSSKKSSFRGYDFDIKNIEEEPERVEIDPNLVNL